MLTDVALFSGVGARAAIRAAGGEAGEDEDAEVHDMEEDANVET